MSDPKPDIAQRVAEIERLMVDATPGPFGQGLYLGGSNYVNAINPDGSVRVHVADCHSSRATKDAAYIVALVSHAPALLEALKVVQQEVNRREEMFLHFARDVSEDMECEPSCDSYGHADSCPLAYPVVAWRKTREQIRNLTQQLAEKDGELQRLQQGYDHARLCEKARYAGEVARMDGEPMEPPEAWRVDDSVRDEWEKGWLMQNCLEAKHEQQLAERDEEIARKTQQYSLAMKQVEREWERIEEIRKQLSRMKAERDEYKRRLQGPQRYEVAE